VQNHCPDTAAAVALGLLWMIERAEPKAARRRDVSESACILDNYA
jgi:hypothetical protein